MNVKITHRPEKTGYTPDAEDAEKNKGKKKMKICQTDCWSKKGDPERKQS